MVGRWDEMRWVVVMGSYGYISYEFWGMVMLLEVSEWVWLMFFWVNVFWVLDKVLW